MTMTLQVFMQGAPLGALSYDSASQLWSFHYAAEWLARDDHFPLSPALPLEHDAAQTAQQHSNAVRIFFENLLPEGQALEQASVAFKISKANSFGLLRALGRETSGALEILSDDAAAAPARVRQVTREDISSRIRSRPNLPFTVWDGRVRLSIAGFQDKLAVLEEENKWYLVDGRSLASTHLLKPEPLHKALAGMTTNERLCMALAGAIGISTAATRLEHVPEPLLVIERFDRVRGPQGVARLHCIDGCQGLGLPVGMKYERPFGSGRDVRDIRDGASLPRLFALLAQHATTPVKERLALLRWAILQVLIGNVDGHAKNLTFSRMQRVCVWLPHMISFAGSCMKKKTSKIRWPWPWAMGPDTRPGAWALPW